ncbi:MAG: Capsular polysaccharide biosynthesis protein [Verrucomicrobia bacterium]|nr:MAG: Capsular polysaccharide biosynthesis protein [Verrucomicrobiota bacterium]
MNVRIKPQPWQRFLHDSYASLPRALKPPLRFVPVEAAPCRREPRVLQSAGSAVLVHPLQTAFLGGPPQQSELRWPERCLHTFGEVRLCGDQARIFFDEASTIGPGTFVWAEKAAKIRRPLPGVRGRACGRVFHLTGEDHDNRAHFLFEYLPRLYVSRELREPGTRLLVAPGHAKWQRRYLELLEIPVEMVMEGSPGTLRAEAVEFVPLLGGEDQYPHLGNPATFREMLGELHASIRRRGWAGSEVAGHGRSLLWISRQDAPGRRLGNEAELIDIARAHYAEVRVILLSEIPFEEQIRLINRYDHIAGAHGQGMHLAALTRGKRILFLEQGKRTRDQSWGAAFRNVAELAGNEAVSLHSGIPYAGTGRDWWYPREKFEADLRRLAEVAPQTSLGTT